MARRSPLLWTLLALSCIALLAAVEYGVRRTISRHLLPTQSARWIWIDNQDDATSPVAFAMQRDFRLRRRPERGRLLIRADEEYQVKLNGVPVGANRYVDDAPIDAYDVSGLLRKGRNRLRVDLRSSRGVGGLLCSLEIDGPEGRRRIVSDDGWEVFREQDPSLGRRRNLSGGEPPKVWAVPPTGRWGVTLETVDRPLFQSLVEGRTPVPAQHYRIEGDDRGWLPVAPAGKGSPPVGSRVTFDFGAPVLGFLAIHLPDGEPPLGLVFISTEFPIPTGERPADAFLLAMPGTGVWAATTPRFLRYVTVQATGPVSGATVFVSDPEPSLALMPREGSETGVFGLEMGPLRTPLENELRRELQRLASVPDGQAP